MCSDIHILFVTCFVELKLHSPKSVIEVSIFFKKIKILVAELSNIPFVLIQLLHRNSNQGLRYMGNPRNGMDPSVVPQGLVGTMMPLPFDGSGVRSGLVPMSALASALASASPENQRLVHYSSSLFLYH